MSVDMMIAELDELAERRAAWRGQVAIVQTVDDVAALLASVTHER